MTRMLKMTVAGLLAGAAAMGLAGCSPATEGTNDAPANAEATVAQRPNVVLILVDDLGWPDVSTYGRHDVNTPNIDRIARSGVAFSSGYVAASVCSLSRAGLLTGRMPQEFGFTYNINDNGNEDAGLPTDQKTIAERLKPLGYHTGLFGKWHQGIKEQFYPTNRGFDEFFGFLTGETVYVDPKTPGIVTTPTKADHYSIAERKPDARVFEGPDRKPVNDFNKYLTAEITDHAVDFINRSAGKPDQPFFAYVAYNAPHWPMQVPKAYYDRFANIKDPVRRTYVAMITAMDDGVGRILDTLKARGVRDNTLIVFLSDNGCPIQFGFCNPAHPWGWGKFTYLEGGIRVPFMMSWPAGLRPRATVDTPVSSLDITPTILHAVAPKDPLPAGLDGVDLINTIEHPPAQPRTLVWGQEPVYAARRGAMKLWRSEDLHTTYLYNIERDKAESTDLSASDKVDHNALAGAVETWRKSLPKPRWPIHMARKVKVNGRETEMIY
jgi:arylsulfatase A-like enzyme